MVWNWVAFGFIFPQWGKEQLNKIEVGAFHFFGVHIFEPFFIMLMYPHTGAYIQL